MSLNGSAPQTLAIPTISMVGNSSSEITGKNGMGVWALSGTQGIGTWTAGSQVTVSGLTGGNASFNGVWVPTGALIPFSPQFEAPKSGTFATTLAAFTASSYPAVMPFMSFGNDTEASPTQNVAACVDFFALCWNSGLATSPLAIASTNSRYWAGS
ncbi:MAG TPA: hypothetical protein VMF66_09235 [Candidatus Acidoferrum sp.]|nr:hypothetical protein [Candidatus Acidoferrum sp.]